MLDPLHKNLASPCPERPRLEEDLDFKRQPMVDWFNPIQLSRTGARTAFSKVFGRYFDKRELQAVLPPARKEPRYDADPVTGELWFDYVADLGDGWNPTYTVAYLLAQRRLRLEAEGTPHELRRGRFLVMGGDQVYPTASARAYQDRLVGPYRSALPCEAEAQVPHVFAIPGNHDWYDGLTSFTRLFCQRNRRWIGGWQTQQERSYFAIRLPYDLWLWGIDVQMESDIDPPQLDYFHGVAEEHGIAGHRIILCTAEPAWVYTRLKEEGPKKQKTFDNLAYFERKVIEAHGARLILTLAGDLHHYSRYTERGRGPHKITSGGGGATLYGTHTLPDELTLPKVEADEIVPATYERKAVFPSRADSMQATFAALRLPFTSWVFSLTMGTLYLLTAWFLQSGTFGEAANLFAGLAAIPPAFGAVPEALSHLLEVALYSPGGVVLLLLFVVGFTAFSSLTTWYAGLVHGLSQALLCLLTTWVFVYLVLNTSWTPLVQALALTLLMIGVGGFLSGFLVGLYLLLVHWTLGLHTNEVFAIQQYQDYKNFLRFRIDPQGITVFPVGIARVGRKWALNPEARPGAPWFEPEDGKPPPATLIETPIHIPHPEGAAAAGQTSEPASLPSEPKPEPR